MTKHFEKYILVKYKHILFIENSSHNLSKIFKLYFGLKYNVFIMF